MKIYELKTDPNLPHHYFIAVGIKTMRDKNPGEMFLKYRPVYIHNSQIEKLRDAVMLSHDKLFPTSPREATAIYGVTEFTHTFHSLRMAAMTNLCSLHHFSSEHEINEEWFSTFVKSANQCKTTKRKLLDAKIS